MEKLFPYQVFAFDGNSVLQAEESCRYSKEIEQNLLDVGYKIMLHGKRILPKTARKDKNADS